jgi:hypothetical protein
MQKTPSGDPTQPVNTGHTFAMSSYAVCADCHVSAENTSNLVVFVNWVITNRIETVRYYLDQWALTKAPAILGTTTYGTRAWEYTEPGALSPGGMGPDAHGQEQIQASAPNIHKARFNLYLVRYDGSYGVHNGLYAITLLDTAENWVIQELIR